MKNALMVVALVAAMSGCGEKPQALQSGGRDAPAYSGTGKAFTTGGWLQGDKASWESQLKARSQYGQNDYTRMN